MDIEAVRLNLSYVLHEPATSAVVHDAARRLSDVAPRVRRAVARLAALPDDALRCRVLVVPSAEPTNPAPTAPVAWTVQVGAWPLLSRVLDLIHPQSPGKGWSVRLLDGPDAAREDTTPFFRGQANLCLAAEPEPGWFASLALRPGGTTLLLRLHSLPHRADDQIDREQAVRLAEVVIRDHAGQWLCERPLWDRPAEAALPEFQRG